MISEQKLSWKIIKVNYENLGIFEPEKILLASPSNLKSFWLRCKWKLYIFLSFFSKSQGWGRDFPLVGGECFYNKMPCYFKWCIVSSQPRAPKSHCMCGLGVRRGVEADKFAVNTQEAFGGTLWGCSDLYWKNQTNTGFEKLLLCFISWL